MQFSLDIVNEKGLHARASAKFVETVERFDARALVSRDGMEVSGDSIMGLMMLGAGRGHLDRRAASRAPRPRRSRAALRALVADRFGEPTLAGAELAGATRLIARPADPEADPDPEPRKTYHHGNLRQALVEATLRLIEEKGPLGFTLAEAARAAGVSPAAPYRHFRGREELIEEVARQGFVMFADRLGTRLRRRPARRRCRALFETGRAYLDFARANPGYYHGDVRKRGVDRRQPRARARRRPGDVGAGRRRRAAGRAPAARAAAAADDDGEPHLGAQPRGGRAVRARPAGGTRALFGRGDAGERHRRSTCAVSG